MGMEHSTSGMQDNFSLFATVASMCLYVQEEKDNNCTIMTNRKYFQTEYMETAKTVIAIHYQHGFFKKRTKKT